MASPPKQYPGRVHSRMFLLLPGPGVTDGADAQPAKGRASWFREEQQGPCQIALSEYAFVAL
ncbi:hypothetical protein NY78_1424 [Desulfovibrio sp. TomC]|nr:hypothetical protein NY78_1424 [Desulfovibrio sp. TomC]